MECTVESIAQIPEQDGMIKPFVQTLSTGELLAPLT